MDQSEEERNDERAKIKSPSLCDDLGNPKLGITMLITGGQKTNRHNQKRRKAVYSVSVTRSVTPHNLVTKEP